MLAKLFRRFLYLLRSNFFTCRSTSQNSSTPMWERGSAFFQVSFSFVRGSSQPNGHSFPPAPLQPRQVRAQVSNFSCPSKLLTSLQLGSDGQRSTHQNLTLAALWAFVRLSPKGPPSHRAACVRANANFRAQFPLIGLTFLCGASCQGLSCSICHGSLLNVTIWQAEAGRCFSELAPGPNSRASTSNEATGTVWGGMGRWCTTGVLRVEFWRAEPKLYRIVWQR